MGRLPDECPDCGAGSGTRAFVDYDPDPNDAQAETDWGQDLPDLKAIVCQECGWLLGVFDPSTLEEDVPGRADEYKVDEELT